MKKLFLAAAFACAPLVAPAQTLPSPAFQALTLSTPLGTASGGTGGNTAATARTSLGAAASGSNSDITSMSALGGGILSIAGTNTGTTGAGLLAVNDSMWSPSGALGSNPDYDLTSISTISLTGGTIAQRWAQSSLLNSVSGTITLPTGTPSSPSGFSDSHVLGNYVHLSIPAGLCDGLGGSSFTGAGGSPGNNCYTELGGDDVQLTSLSPGHLLEGMSSQEFDSSGGTGAVPLIMTGYTNGMVKDSATNTYHSVGFVANSIGTQQTTYAPTDAFQVAGGWQNGIDFTSGTYNACEIAWLGGQCTTSNSSGMTLNLGATQFGINSSLNGSAFQVSDGGIYGATISLIGNGATTPTKYLQVSNGQFNILNSANSTAILSLTDAGNLSVTGTIKTQGYTVSTLPAGTVGARSYVTDATVCSLNGTLTGSGTTFCPVIYNGTAWVGD